jgi:predicted DNA-binding transcriptional regulator AlpA
VITSATRWNGAVLQEAISMESSNVGDIIRGWREAELATGLGRTQLWRYARAGKFPAPIELGPNSLGWPRAEIEGWLAGRPRRTYGRPPAAA